MPWLDLIAPLEAEHRPAGDYRAPEDAPGYGAAALRGEIETLLAAKEGSRNHTLNIVGVKLFSLVASGHLSETVVEDELRRAAEFIDLGQAEISATIRSARKAGLANPRGPIRDKSVIQLRPETAPDPATGPTVVSSWNRVDIAGVLAGDTAPLESWYLKRADGLGLLYPGRLHSFHGEGESMKSWAAQVLTAYLLRAGSRVAYYDYESEARDIVARLKALGVSDERLVSGLCYIRPDEALSDAARTAILLMTEAWRPEATILDGVDAAMELEGLNPDKEYRRWYHRLGRPLQLLTAGPTVQVDHVTKSKELRGDYAAGDRAKRNIIDGAAFGFEVIKPFGRGLTGTARMLLHKDRGGALRGHVGTGKEIARLRLTSGADETVAWELLVPESAGTDGDGDYGFRPTVYMERLSRRMEQSPDTMSKNDVEKAGLGKVEYVRMALDRLVEEGYVEAAHGPRGSKLHRSLKPYREVTQ